MAAPVRLRARENDRALCRVRADSVQRPRLIDRFVAPISQSVCFGTLRVVPAFQFKDSGLFPARLDLAWLIVQRSTVSASSSARPDAWVASC